MQKIILIILLLFTLSSIILADSQGPPSPYIAKTADQKYLFVMLNCGKEYSQIRYKDSVYKQCGMYLNDGSTNPLWTVDWTGDVYLPNNSEFVVKRGGWAGTSGAYMEEAFSFYSNGRLLKRYATKDLVDFPWLLPHSSNHYQWQYDEGEAKTSALDGTVLRVFDVDQDFRVNYAGKIDNENQTLSITTNFSDKFTFDLKTGEIVSAFRPSRIVFSILSVILLLAYFLFRPKFSNSWFISFCISFIFCASIIILPMISAYPFFLEQKRYENFLSQQFSNPIGLFYWLFYQIPPFFLSKFGVANILTNINSLGADLSWTLAFWIFCLVSVFVFDKVFISFVFRKVIQNKLLVLSKV